MQTERPRFNETSQHRQLCDDIYQALPKKRSAFVVTIDGRDCAGKSTLARYLASQLQMTALELDVFRDLDQSAFDFRLPDLQRAIQARTKRDRHVIVEGVTVGSVLRQISVVPDYKIFVDHDDPCLDPPPAKLRSYLVEYRPEEGVDFTFSW